MPTIQRLRPSMQFMPHVQDARELPGIYALWCREGRTLSLLSVKESENIKISLLLYNKLQTWRMHSANHIIFSACYTPGLTVKERQEQAERMSKNTLYTRTEW